MSRKCFIIVVQPRRPELLDQDFEFVYSEDVPEVPFIRRLRYLSQSELSTLMNELEQRTEDHDGGVATFRVNSYNGELVEDFDTGLGDLPRILHRLDPDRVIRPRTKPHPIVGGMFGDIGIRIPKKEAKT